MYMRERTIFIRLIIFTLAAVTDIGGTPYKTSRTVERGHDVELNCPYDASKKIKNAWFFARKEDETPALIRSRPRNPRRKEDVATLYNNEATLWLDNPRARDLGFYIYRSIKRPVKVFCVVHLNVLSPPHASTPMTSPVVVHEGRTVHLKCSASGNPTPSIHWYRMDRDTVFTDTHVDGTTLTVHNVTKYNAGRFECRATNTMSSHSVTITLAVKFAPVIDVYESEVAAEEKSRVTLMCQVTANPMVDVIWTKGNNSRRLRPDYRFVLTRDDEMVTSHQTRYLLLTIRPGQLHGRIYGEYWCGVSGFGPRYRRRVLLKRPAG